MKIYFVAFTCMLLFAHCNKNEPNNDNPLIQDRMDIDINNDGIKDYNIQYQAPNMGGPHEGVLTGLSVRFLAYGENEILQHHEENNLFLRNLDDIEETPATPLFWTNLPICEIVSITTNTKGEWPLKWNINADTEHTSYFLGLKMMTEMGVQLAWIELKINTSNGNVTILDKGLL